MLLKEDVIAPLRDELDHLSRLVIAHAPAPEHLPLPGDDVALGLVWVADKVDREAVRVFRDPIDRRAGGRERLLA